MSPIHEPAEVRFWRKVDRTSGDCWLWTGAISNTGYGSFNTGFGKYKGAHRFAYELLVGPVAAGLHLDHLCRNRACVNPRHLEPVSARINARRGNGGVNNAVKTHCAQGHEFTPENTYVSIRGTTGLPVRTCKTCHQESTRRHRELHGERHNEARRQRRAQAREQAKED